MESIHALKSASVPIDRDAKLKAWLKEDCFLTSFTLHPMRGAASFRRYFRIKVGDTSYVAMDAPPAYENCRAYIAITHALREMNLKTPEIFAANLEQGFLLITDFGDRTYLNSLNEQNVHHFYDRALSALAVLQGLKTVPGHLIPDFTADLMWQEWAWHKEWFLNKLLKLDISVQEKALDASFQYLVAMIVSQPQVFMHRDFHSANLMILEDDEVGILDFQDAFKGPITYDLVSLLRDCYIDWRDEEVKKWVNQYRLQCHEKNILREVDEAVFIQWFDLMGMERHLKALFTFARKCLRDGETAYLAHIPRTLNYLIQVSKAYPSLLPMHDYFDQVVRPTFMRGF